MLPPAQCGWKGLTSVKVWALGFSIFALQRKEALHGLLRSLWIWQSAAVSLIRKPFIFFKIRYIFHVFLYGEWLSLALGFRGQGACAWSSKGEDGGWGDAQLVKRYVSLRTWVQIPSTQVKFPVLVRQKWGRGTELSKQPVLVTQWAQDSVEEPISKKYKVESMGRDGGDKWCQPLVFSCKSMYVCANLHTQEQVSMLTPNN